MSPEIIEDMVEENRVVSQYSKLMAGMEFEFRGKSSPAHADEARQIPDRATRKEAYEVLGKTLKAHSQQLDGIFDQLVHIRDRMAKKMGYQNFVELGYYRMGRLCYGPKEVKEFRENVRRDVVPVVSACAPRWGRSWGWTPSCSMTMTSSSPRATRPQGRQGGDLCRRQGHVSRHEPGRREKFIDFMLETEAFDVESRKNKWGGGYCTHFMAYHQPFILANFNGTQGDVEVITHEAGHAFAAYKTASNKYVVELGVGGMETAETHSMSMEFFAWPYMDKFFGEDAKRYEFMHLLDALSFLPYGTIVDDFQRQVYENPDWTPEERKGRLAASGGGVPPHITFDGIPYLEEGTRWQYQMHIYETPFYYIDYCLAQTAALQFLLASRADYDDAFRRYVHFLSQGGEKVFTDLLQEAGLKSPSRRGPSRPWPRRARPCCASWKQPWTAKTRT